MYRGSNTREGVRTGVETRVRIKRGKGMKGLVDKSRGIVTRIPEDFPNIKPREPLRLARNARQAVRIKRN